MRLLATYLRRAGLTAFCLSLMGSSRLPGAQFILETATIAEIQAAMEAGALTSEKLVQLYLARIEAYDKAGPRINSIITLNPKALAEARALDEERKVSGPRSKLHGIPVLFKDLVDIAGLPTTAGHVPFGAPVPQRDATIVARLKAAGAVMLGKASTRDWFGNYNRGTGYEDHPIGLTLNPYNLRHATGITSNGSGAAMAAWFATLAIGTDNSASVQMPAANSGVVGMVATQGMVSRAGIMPGGALQDRPGPMARSVHDVAAMISVLAGWDAEDLLTFRAMGHFPQGDWSDELRATDIVGKRIGVLSEMIYDGPAHEEAREIFQQALADMRDAGAMVIDPVLTGIDLKRMTLSAHTSTSSGDRRHFQNAYLARLGSASKFRTVEDMLASEGRPADPLGPPETDPVYLTRYRTREMFIKLVHDTMDRFGLDAIAIPYRTIPPERLDEARPGEMTNNFTSSMGLPAVIVPGGYTKENLPIGIQILGRQHSDLLLLQVAYGYEQASRKRKSPVLTPALPGESFEYTPSTKPPETL